MREISELFIKLLTMCQGRKHQRSCFPRTYRALVPVWCILSIGRHCEISVAHRTNPSIKFRLHGHRQPEDPSSSCGGSGGRNEIWEFGATAYPIIVKVILLREQLRDYVMAQVRVDLICFDLWMVKLLLDETCRFCWNASFATNVL